jgi:hypothetical protein
MHCHPSHTLKLLYIRKIMLDETDDTHLGEG